MGKFFRFIRLKIKYRLIFRTRNEVENVIGVRTHINYDDISKLKYCSSVLKEALRIDPPFPSIERITDSEFTICGLNIPNETVLLVILQVILFNLDLLILYYNHTCLAKLICLQPNGK